MQKLVLIDGNAIIHRAYHAIPKTFSNRKGEQTNVSYGFATTLIKVLEDLQPEYIAATFDLPGGTFRHEAYTDYKATRVKADQELYDQIPRVKQIVEAFGIPIYEMEGFEADDCLGTIVQQIQETRNKIPTFAEATAGRQETNKSQTSNSKIQNDVIFADAGIPRSLRDPENYGGKQIDRSQIKSGMTTGKEIAPQKRVSPQEVAPPSKETARDDNNLTIEQSNNIIIYIVSGDKDIYQLINGNVFVYSLRKGLSQMQVVDHDTIKNEYNLDPEDFIDLKALAGDPSDNIPGVPGIGPKTATELIQRFDTLQQLYDAIADKLDGAGVISKSEFLISNKIPNDNSENLEIEKFVENWKLKIENCAVEINDISKALEIRTRVLELLIKYYPQALLSQHLATIHRDVPIDFDLEESRFGQYDKDALRELFEELGFQSLLRRFSPNKSQDGAEKQPATIKRTEVQKKDEQLKLL